MEILVHELRADGRNASGRKRQIRDLGNPRTVLNGSGENNTVLMALRRLRSILVSKVTGGACGGYVN